MVHSTNHDSINLKLDSWLHLFALDYYNVGIEVQICEGQSARTLMYEMDDDYVDRHEALDDKGC